MCCRLGLALATLFSVCRGAWHRRVFLAGVNVYRRDRARKPARQAGRLLPVQRCGRYPASLPFELPDRAVPLRVGRMAMEVGYLRDPRPVFSRDAFLYSPKPALARIKEQNR